MTRLFMFILGLAALVYMEPGSDALFLGWLLPAVALVSFAYVFWLGGFIAILLGALAFHYTDMDAESILRAVLLPLLMGVSAIYLLWWSIFAGGLIDSLGDLGGCDGDGGGGGGGD